MPAYMISDVNVVNAERYEDYLAAISEAVQKHGGRYLVRAHQTKVLEGTWNPARVVVIEFASMADAERFYSSEQFLAARELRQNVAMVNMILAEGVQHN
jgi:uncharacterized protein (DUF1330 family)